MQANNIHVDFTGTILHRQIIKTEEKRKEISVQIAFKLKILISEKVIIIIKQ